MLVTTSQIPKAFRTDFCDNRNDKDGQSAANFFAACKRVVQRLFLGLIAIEVGLYKQWVRSP